MMILAAGSARAETPIEHRVRELEDLVRKQGELLERQQRRIEAQDERLQAQDAELKRQAADGPPASAQPPGAETAATQPTKKTESVAVSVKTGVDGLTVASEDEDFVFRVGGRLQTDLSFIDEDVTPFGNGAEIRRARLKAEGTMFREWDYKLEVNFETDRGVDLTDAWLRYSGFEPFTVTVGHQKVPFSQQSMTSSNWQVFQERGLPDAFIDNPETGRRRLGIVGQSYGQHWNLAAGIFGEGVDDASPSSENYGPAMRGVLFPIVGKTELLTIGGAVYYRNMTQQEGISFAARPEDHVTGVRLVDTGDLGRVDQLLMYNGETSSVWGPFHAQAEYTGATLGRDRGRSNLEFFGFYAQAGFFLTGESRNFDPTSAKFKRITPKGIVGRGGIGAWEIAARYSYLDLSSSGVRGGIQRDVTAGLNWWATPNVMFRLNYVFVNPDPNSARTLGGIDEHINVFEGRAQIVF